MPIHGERLQFQWSHLVGLDPNGLVDYLDGSPVFFFNGALRFIAFFGDYNFIWSFVIYVFVIK